MNVRVILLAGAAVLAAAAAGAQSPGPVTAAPPLDVPYVSQGELLCGGAAAAMLLRYWGARGVYAEDFAPLIDKAAGGITTAALANAVRERGWRATTFSGSDEMIRQALQRGEPVIALMEDRPGRYHYVVIVGWRDGSVVYHDPSRGPLQTRGARAFDRSWAPANRWAMEVLPGPKKSTDSADSTDSDARNDEALAAFEQQQYREAARRADERLHRDPHDADAWRILGASRYLESRKAEALDAWNHVDEPRVDLVAFEGLEGTPYGSVERLVGLKPRDVLTAAQFRRAGRRLALLPAADSSSLTYTALPGGIAEVTGAVVAAPRTPRLTDWLVQGIKLPFTRDVSASFGNPLHQGGHWTAMWRFQTGRPAVHVGVDLPAGPLPGIWSVDAGWETNTFQIGGTAAASMTRRAGRVGWTDWIAADTRFAAGAGVARWDGRGSSAIVDAAIQQRAWSDHLAFGVGVSGARGATPFATTIAHLAWRTGETPIRAMGSVVLSRASARTPLDLWPYAGAGSGRELLLRAHDLREGGALVGDVYGRGVDQGTIELQRDVYGRGLATLAIAGFTDMGRISRRADRSTSPFEVDAGIGLRIRGGIGDRVVRVDLARALRDDGLVLSAGYQVTWFDRKARQ